MIGLDESPLLRINRVVVTGDLGCDIRLGPGINIVRGEAYQGDIRASNDCGKTIFTDLIKYGLGDRDRFTAGEIAKSIGMLSLEFDLNDSTITIVRNLNKPSARIAVHEGEYQPAALHKEPDFQIDPRTPYSDFLLERLGIPKVRFPQSGKPGAPIRPITFQDFMRVLYMDQKNDSPEKRGYLFRHRHELCA